MQTHYQKKRIYMKIMKRAMLATSFLLIGNTILPMDHRDSSPASATQNKNPPDGNQHAAEFNDALENLVQEMRDEEKWVNKVDLATPYVALWSIIALRYITKNCGIDLTCLITTAGQSFGVGCALHLTVLPQLTVYLQSRIIKHYDKSIEEKKLTTVQDLKKAIKENNQRKIQSALARLRSEKQKLTLDKNKTLLQQLESTLSPTTKGEKKIKKP